MSRNNGLNEENMEMGQHEDIEVINVSRREGNPGAGRRNSGGDKAGNMRRSSGEENAGNVRRSPNGENAGNVRRSPGGENAGNVRRSPHGGNAGNVRRNSGGESIGNVRRNPGGENPGNRQLSQDARGQTYRRNPGEPDVLVSTGRPRMLERPENAGRPGSYGRTGSSGRSRNPEASENAGKPRMLEPSENGGRPGSPRRTVNDGRPRSPEGSPNGGRPRNPEDSPNVGRPRNPEGSPNGGRPRNLEGSYNGGRPRNPGIPVKNGGPRNIDMPVNGITNGNPGTVRRGRNGENPGNIRPPRPAEGQAPVNNRNPERSEQRKRNFDQRNLDRINSERPNANRRYSNRRNSNTRNSNMRNSNMRYSAPGNSGRRRGGGGIGPGILIGLLLLLVVVGAGGYFYVGSLAYKVCRAQAGSTVTPSDFMKNEDANAVFAEGSDAFDITVPGEYHVKVKSGLFTHKCTLIIEDTIPPTADPVSVTIPVGTTCGPESFVSNIQDVTEVTVSFASQPDFSRKGTQAVQIILTDRGNNRVTINSELYLSIVAENVTVEAGQGVPGLDRFVAAGEAGQFLTDMYSFDYTKVGEYPVDLLVNGENYTSIMHIVDTVPPVVEVHDIEDFAFVPRSAADFASSIEDVTEVAASFKKEPDLSLVGTQEVELVFTDAGNNRTEKKAKLTLKEDKEAPVIHGAVDLVIYAGDTVSYKKDVTITDNATDGLTLDVDTSKVNTKAEGVYPVTYVASDAAGNTSTVTINLTVKARLYDIDEVNALGDSVLARIITQDMTDMDKLEAIYTYIMGHIGYINDSEKGDWVQAAYEGLMNRKGDCYVYASTAKLLLTRAGIKNMDIEKIPSDTLHYWNLVDIGDGWYHFDTTPRKDHPRIFMWDDQQMMDYSDTHDKSHNYDHTLYPRVNGSTQESLPDTEYPAE